MEAQAVLDKIHKAKNGDKDAFSELYSLFYQPLFKFVRFRLSGDINKTEDVVSETFLKWFESLSKYEPTIKPLHYLFLIASRIIINEGVRKKTDSLEKYEYWLIKDESQSVEDILNTEFEYNQIKDIIDESLNDSEKQVLYLKYNKDFNNSEISGIIGKKENNLRQIEYRALEKIRHKYKEMYEN